MSTKPTTNAKPNAATKPAQPASTDAATSLRIERTFDASPQHLWAYWTDPKKFATWFNPAPGHDIVVHEWDARPGGKVRFDMPQPDGNRNPQAGVFHSLTPHTEIVQGSPDRSLLITVRLEPQGARTRMRVEVVGVPAEGHAMATKGWNAGLDKLDGQLDALLADRSIVLSRVFAAPRERVWAAFTERDQVAQWWGPTGFRTTTRRMEVKPGGTWEFTMHGPDGTDHPNWIRYEEVSKPHKLRYAHGGGRPDDDKPDFQVLVTFEDLQGRTRVTMRSLFPTREAKDHVVRAYRAIEGGQQTLARLAEHLAPSPPPGTTQLSAPPASRELHIVRVLAAPRAKVWRALTEPELLAQWWGRGNKVVVERYEFQRGGHWRFVEHSAGEQHGFEGRFAGIEAPERLEMTFEWDGLPGHVTLQRMALEELPDGRTKLVAVSLFMTQEDRDGMVASGMEQGMDQSYAALDEVLAGMG